MKKDYKEILRRLEKFSKHVYEERENLKLDLGQTTSEFRSLFWSRYYYYKQFYYDVLFTEEWQNFEKIDDKFLNRDFSKEINKAISKSPTFKRWYVAGYLDKPKQQD